MQENFSEKVSAWIESNCPEYLRHNGAFQAKPYAGGKKYREWHSDQVLWCQRVASKGWTVPEWPTEYGGAGLSAEEGAVIRHEMSRLGAPIPLVGMGVSMVGPVLMKYGTPDQKLLHLPAIARGEVWWCQGYSEPGAGSDLASLATRAELCDGFYEVNGQKVWTSDADKADWIFCLVRTSKEGSKHQGISFLLFDMTSSGVTVNPIKLISGLSPFCEIFLDKVKVPATHLLGAEGQGWEIATYLLTHEREMQAGFGLLKSEASLVEKARGSYGLDSNGCLRNSALRAELAQFRVDSVTFDIAQHYASLEGQHGDGMGARSSVYKYYGTELNMRKNELNIAIAGRDGLLWEGPADDQVSVSRQWLRSKGNSIEGGTSEIQLNIIAKALLELPKI